MFRTIFINWSGEGREVAGVGAAISRVGFEDFPTFDGAKAFESAMVSSLWAAGFSPFSENMVSNGVGESFRAVEFWVVSAESGKNWDPMGKRWEGGK